MRQLLLEFEGLQNTRHLALLNYEAADLNLAGKRFEIASLLNHIHANEPEEVQQEFATADAYAQAVRLDPNDRASAYYLRLAQQGK